MKKYKNSKIFIAGHNGLVGSAIYNKLKLEGYKNYNIKDVYRIWFSFFDPILRCSLLNEIINDSFNFEKINIINEKISYRSFLKNNDLKIVFDKIFL